MCPWAAPEPWSIFHAGTYTRLSLTSTLADALWAPHTFFKWQGLDNNPVYCSILPQVIRPLRRREARPMLWQTLLLFWPNLSFRGLVTLQRTEKWYLSKMLADNIIPECQTQKKKKRTSPGCVFCAVVNMVNITKLSFLCRVWELERWPGYSVTSTVHLYLCTLLAIWLSSKQFGFWYWEITKNLNIARKCLGPFLNGFTLIRKRFECFCEISLRRKGLKW